MMRDTKTKLGKLYRLPLRHKLMLGETCLLLPATWVLVKLIPFRWWSSWLGTSSPGEGEGEGAHPCARDIEEARDVAWAILAINRRVGEHFTCLMLAMAAQWMLSRRHISSRLVLGTRTLLGQEQKLVIKAHAWLKVGKDLVLGQHGHQFTAMMNYSRTYDSMPFCDPL